MIHGARIPIWLGSAAALAFAVLRAGSGVSSGHPGTIGRRALGAPLPAAFLVARSIPWTAERTLRGDTVLVRSASLSGTVEALIPSGVPLNDPDRVDWPMLWRRAEWSSLLDMHSDRPPKRVSPMRLAEVVVIDGVEPSDVLWMIDQALLQLAGLREYLRAAMEHTYPDVNPLVMSETSRRALYVRAQLLCTFATLGRRDTLNAATREELRSKIGTGPEDWVPLRALDALARLPGQTIQLRLPCPLGYWRRWRGSVTAARSMLLKLAEAARVAGMSEPDLALLAQRLEYAHKAVRDADQAGSGSGLRILERRVGKHLRLVGQLADMRRDADRVANAQKLGKDLISLNRRVRNAAEVAGGRHHAHAPSYARFAASATAHGIEPMRKPVRVAYAALRAEAPLGATYASRETGFTIEELETSLLPGGEEPMLTALADR